MTEIKKTTWGRKALPDPEVGCDFVVERNEVLCYCLRKINKTSSWCRLHRAMMKTDDEDENKPIRKDQTRLLRVMPDINTFKRKKIPTDGGKEAVDTDESNSEERPLKSKKKLKTKISDENVDKSNIYMNPGPSKLDLILLREVEQMPVEGTSGAADVAIIQQKVKKEETKVKKEETKIKKEETKIKKEEEVSLGSEDELSEESSESDTVDTPAPSTGSIGTDPKDIDLNKERFKLILTTGGMGMISIMEAVSAQTSFNVVGLGRALQMTPDWNNLLYSAIQEWAPANMMEMCEQSPTMQLCMTVSMTAFFVYKDNQRIAAKMAELQKQSSDGQEPKSTS